MVHTRFTSKSMTSQSSASTREVALLEEYADKLRRGDASLPATEETLELRVDRADRAVARRARQNGARVLRRRHARQHVRQHCALRVRLDRVEGCG